MGRIFFGFWYLLGGDYVVEDFDVYVLCGGDGVIYEVVWMFLDKLGVYLVDCGKDGVWLSVDFCWWVDLVV